MTTAGTPALLVLEDGKAFRGYRFGARVEGGGEVVFNTAMTGYQEILGDPSYAGQVVVMTYPMIGNYGIAADDFESSKSACAGLVVKEPSRIASNWRHEKSLEQYLEEQGVPGFYGLDTRALTHHLRDHGSMRGVIGDASVSVSELVARAKAIAPMAGRDLASTVTTREPYEWTSPRVELGTRTAPLAAPVLHIVVYDFGVKRNILRSLVELGARVTVVPARTSAKDVLALQPDGVVLSNGPGDPEPLDYAIGATRELMGKVPVFGICLGHQILALASGARTYKLKFGHHGANHPVMDTTTGKVEITSQNHGFAVDPKTLPACLELTHVNLNDQTVSGIRRTDVPAFSVQYHPEAAPGPRDAHYLFTRFAHAMHEAKHSSKSRRAAPKH